MNERRRLRLAAKRSALAVLLVLAVPLGGRAAAPTVTYLFPAGAQRGTRVEVQAGGTFDAWPVEVWSSAKEIEARPGKAKGTLQVKVAADAVPGTYWLRLYNADGASRLCPFIVGTLPEVMEKEPNDDPRAPQALPGSEFVVNGRLARSQDVDHYALALRKGQTLVASLTANRVLGSPMDGVLQVVSADGFVLADNNDCHGLDPQLAFAVPRDGTYVVRVFAFPATPESSIRLAGGETFIYRMTLTTGGFADHAFPLAVSLKDETPVRLCGWNLPETARAALGRDGPVEAWPVHAAGAANAVAVRAEPHPTVLEQEPNGGGQPQAIEPPVTVSGHIDPPGDVDVYRFTARKGQKLVFQVEARALGSPLDPVLRLTDAAGKTLQEVDDVGPSADPEVIFDVPADGVYHVAVRDLHGDGGWRFVYRLRAVPAEPDYVLTVASDRFTGTAAGTLDIPVTVVRRNGFTGPVEVKIEGLPEGVTAAAPAAAAGATSVTLKLRAPAQPVNVPVRIVGQAPGLPPRTARAVLGPNPSGRSGRRSAAPPTADNDLLWLTLRPAKPAAK